MTIQVPEKNIYSAFNFASDPIGVIDPEQREGAFRVWIRVTEIEKSNGAKGPSDFNRIAYGVVSLKGEFLEYEPFYLLPEGDAVALEDPRFQNGMLICNEIHRKGNDKISIPVIYDVNNGAPKLVGRNDMLIGSKVLVFLNDEYVLSRPWEPAHDPSQPAVILYHVDESSKDNRVEKLSPVKTFHKAPPNADLAGLSTPPVEWDSDHNLVIVHDASIVSPDVHLYRHSGKLVNKHDPMQSPKEIGTIYSRSQFGKVESSWVHGAVYVDNVHIIEGHLIGFVTIDDSETRLEIRNIKHKMAA